MEVIKFKPFILRKKNLFLAVLLVLLFIEGCQGKGKGGHFTYVPRNNEIYS